MPDPEAVDDLEAQGVIDSLVLAVADLVREAELEAEPDGVLEPDIVAVGVGVGGGVIVSVTDIVVDPLTLYEGELELLFEREFVMLCVVVVELLPVIVWLAVFETLVLAVIDCDAVLEAENVFDCEVVLDVVGLSEGVAECVDENECVDVGVGGGVIVSVVVKVLLIEIVSDAVAVIVFDCVNVAEGESVIAPEGVSETDLVGVFDALDVLEVEYVFVSD